mmetsp:Transcript_48223/g.73407  ORF Transcript_48223/g.73407 Transcript_48223/m.73407 type:complete len:165 (-) Transcript_48223:288-782(-)
MTTRQPHSFSAGFYLVFSVLLLFLRSSHGFHSSPLRPTFVLSSSASAVSSTATPTTTTTRLHGLPKQNPGESDVAYIKRLTSMSDQMLASGSETNTTTTTNGTNGDDDAPKTKKKGTYQRIEEWDAERKANGTLSWEERVQYEGQRYGNQVRQNDILQKNLNMF